MLICILFKQKIRFLLLNNLILQQIPRELQRFVFTDEEMRSVYGKLAKAIKYGEVYTDRKCTIKSEYRNIISEMVISPLTSLKSQKCTGTFKFTGPYFKIFETNALMMEDNRTDPKNSQVRRCGVFLLEQKGGKIEIRSINNFF